MISKCYKISSSLNILLQALYIENSAFTHGLRGYLILFAPLPSYLSSILERKIAFASVGPFHINTFNCYLKSTIVPSKILVKLHKNTKDDNLVFHFYFVSPPTYPTPSHHNDTSSLRFTAAAARSWPSFYLPIII